MKKKYLKELLDKFYIRNKELQAENARLKTELEESRLEFIDKYEYVILVNNGKTNIYQKGNKLKRIYNVKFEHYIGEIPTLFITYK